MQDEIYKSRDLSSPDTTGLSLMEEDNIVACDTLCKFVKLIRTNYRDNPYHMWAHCADVTHTVYRIIALTQSRVKLTSLEVFGLMVAAMCHDLDHPGVNNQFLVRTQHPLAIVYNDASVLENHHVASLYRLVSTNPDADVLAPLSD